MTTTNPTKRKLSETEEAIIAGDELRDHIIDETDALLVDLGRAYDIIFNARKRLKKIHTMAGKANMPCIVEDAVDEDEIDYETGLIGRRGHYDEDECPHNMESMVKEMEEVLIPKLKKRITFCVDKWP